MVWSLSGASGGRTVPTIACNLGVAIALTLALIVLNANYSPINLEILSRAQIYEPDAILTEQLVEQLDPLSTQRIAPEINPLNEPSQHVEELVIEATPPPTEEEKAIECPDPGSGPQFTSLRVVEDITEEKDVDLILDIHKEPQFTSVPQPMTTGKVNVDELCNQYKWRFCVNIGGQEAEKNKLFYTCETRDFIAKTHCAYIDGRERVFGGLVYDHNRRFPVHASHPGDTSLNANSNYGNVVRYKKLSHNLAVYPWATAHVFERLPRLFLLIKGLPEDVPILMPDNHLTQGIVDTLDKYQVFNKSRVVWWDADKIYYADTVYFAGEMGLIPEGDSNERTKWNTLRVEHCSWAISQPRWLIQNTMQKLFYQADPEGKLRVVVVHRKDAGSRMINNHDEMVQKIQEGLPGDVVVSTFVGSEHDAEDTLKIFSNADILVAPHGAALTFCSVMRPGGAVIEIAYGGRDGMDWPGNYFHTMAVGSKLAYYFSVGNGGYGRTIDADIPDVVTLADWAYKHVKESMKKEQEGEVLENDHEKEASEVE